MLGISALQSQAEWAHTFNHGTEMGQVATGSSAIRPSASSRGRVVGLRVKLDSQNGLCDGSPMMTLSNSAVPTHGDRLAFCYSVRRSHCLIAPVFTTATSMLDRWDTGEPQAVTSKSASMGFRARLFCSFYEQRTK